MMLFKIFITNDQVLILTTKNIKILPTKLFLQYIGNNFKFVTLRIFSTPCNFFFFLKNLIFLIKPSKIYLLNKGLIAFWNSSQKQIIVIKWNNLKKINEILNFKFFNLFKILKKKDLINPQSFLIFKLFRLKTLKLFFDNKKILQIQSKKCILSLLQYTIYWTKPPFVNKVSFSYNSIFYDFNHKYYSLFYKQTVGDLYKINFFKTVYIFVHNINYISFIFNKKSFKWVDKTYLLLNNSLTKVNPIFFKLIIFKFEIFNWFNLLYLKLIYSKFNTKYTVRDKVKTLMVNIFGNLKYITQKVTLSNFFYNWLNLIILNNRILMQKFYFESTSVILSNTDNLLSSLPLLNIFLLEKIGLLKISNYYNLNIEYNLFNKSVRNYSFKFFPYKFINANLKKENLINMKTFFPNMLKKQFLLRKYKTLKYC